jgi:nitrate/TMAO reductase-like tetraheme cytochrome c subunit
MSQASSSPGRKRFAILPVIIGTGILAVLLTASGFVFAASQETHDPFCASCHTQPESSFFQRSIAAQPTDLASFHTTQKTLCINCHSGQGVFGRVQAELMGARNAFKWFTGTAVQPAVLTYAIGDQNCLKCHQNVTSRGFTPQEQITVPGGRAGRGEGEGGNNHWHVQLARWQATTPTAGRCVSCHPGHAADTNALNGFMNAQNVQAECNACHQVLRREGGG